MGAIDEQVLAVHAQSIRYLLTPDPLVVARPLATLFNADDDFYVDMRRSRQINLVESITECSYKYILRSIIPAIIRTSYLWKGVLHQPLQQQYHSCLRTWCYNSWTTIIYPSSTRPHTTTRAAAAAELFAYCQLGLAHATVCSYSYEYSYCD